MHFLAGGHLSSSSAPRRPPPSNPSLAGEAWTITAPMQSLQTRKPTSSYRARPRSSNPPPAPTPPALLSQPSSSDPTTTGSHKLPKSILKKSKSMYISQQPSHRAESHRSLYDHAWGRVRNYQPGMHGLGVGLNEARHWHRRAYGGLGELTTMRPTEIGHAAAYEAYRTWIHNSSIYEPLSGDLERQREGLIGLAIAEAARLLQYTQSPYDTYARTEASDAAAATASIIFYQSREDGQDEYRSRPRSRAGSFAGGSGYASSIGGDPYALDDPLLSSRRYRSRSRHRSLSRGRGSPTIINLPPQMPSGGMPYPGQAGSAYGMPPPVGGYPPMGGGYPGSAGSYGSFGSPYSSSFPPENAAMQPGVGGFAGGAPGYGPNYAGSAFGGSAYGAGMPMMNPSASMGYGQPPYMMQQPMMGMAPTAGPTTVILQSSRRKHRHRHRRSSDGYASD